MLSEESALFVFNGNRKQRNFRKRLEKGAEDMRYGCACFLAMLFAFVGVVLGVLGRMEKDKFYLFSYIGIALNLAAIGMVSLILNAGALL